MDPKVVEQRLRLGEDSETELKSVAHLGFSLNKELSDTLAKEIAAFANSGGGWIILGAEDDGTPTGVGTLAQADKIMQGVSQLCQTVVDPAIPCRITKMEVSGNLLLIVEVPAWSPNRPFQARGKFYVRDGTIARPASRDELRTMLESQAIHLDEQPARGASREDLDPEQIALFLQSTYGDEAALSPGAYLRSLKCVDEGGQPTVTGILFFGKDPQRFFGDARITAVRFGGESVSSDIVERLEIDSGLFRQIEQAERFLEAYVPKPAKIEGFHRVDRGIPRVVLREVLHNAVAHRDYNVASQITVLAFSDRVQIMNPGGLLNRMTVEGIKLVGTSQRRNPNIAALIMRAARRESAGIGIPRMIDEMRRAGLPEPEIEVVGGFFRVELRYAPEAVA
jgi:ATP-dependent DNA helicase RecG